MKRTFYLIDGKIVSAVEFIRQWQAARDAGKIRKKPNFIDNGGRTCEWETQYFRKSRKAKRLGIQFVVDTEREWVGLNTFAGAKVAARRAKTFGFWRLKSGRL